MNKVRLTNCAIVVIGGLNHNKNTFFKHNNNTSLFAKIQNMSTQATLKPPLLRLSLLHVSRIAHSSCLFMLLLARQLNYQEHGLREHIFAFEILLRSLLIIYFL